ncbi:MAG: pSer/pThr/pTyr-binding forkhead associated (FHA) protein [Cognaticolwellia sp.]|jgi:pSer/pThr/pTyr-binding forkhead associated (FHA) protein
MSASVLVLALRSPGAEEMLLVTPLPFTVGRSPNCELELDDPKVSGRHAMVRLSDTGLQIEDLDSGNGVWQGPKRVTSSDWPMDVTLRFGESSLRPIRLVQSESRVLRLFVAGRDRQRAKVVRLPAGVALEASRELKVDRKARGAVLLAREHSLSLLQIVDGEVKEAVSDEQGQLSFFGHTMQIEHAREPASLPTDLQFGADGSVTVIQDTAPPSGSNFPPACFQNDVVDLSELQAAGVQVTTSDFLALGGGLGSFCWVDALRVHGIPSKKIRVIGFENKPYSRYERLCSNSQIPRHERLRSNSESCPDNYWGFPGYGAREAWTAFKKLRWAASLSVLSQLVREPDFASTYTPRADDVFKSIDQEAQRIGWQEMLDTGRIRSIRKTSDGRYAVAVSSRIDPNAPRAVFVSPVVHLAVGYPGLRFLPDLREYRERTRDFVRVVNAYENHDALYERLATAGGTVVLRGRGIVASRVLQRLYELREGGSSLKIVHLMRSKNDEGARHGPSTRRVENHWEFQPFNWPEACWGGDLKRELARADGEGKRALLSSWGGTTTADRSDWKEIVRVGLKEGWYRIEFAKVNDIESRPDGLMINLARVERQAPVALPCVAIIDATGLISGSQADPVLADLIETYKLSLNVQGRLEVEPSFELSAMRNGQGRLFAAGVCTLGSHYAPVDSFLGLQYSASASIDALKSVPPLGSASSIAAWTRWVRGGTP